MVENKKVPHKHAEVIKAWADGKKIEFNNYDTIWTECDEPKWRTDLNYRIKPKWPKTTMTIREMYSVLSPSARVSIEDVIALSNAAIAHALETGLVVLPNSIADTSERDMKLASAVWDAAIKSVATHPEFYYSLHFPKMLKGIISTVK